LKKHILVIAQYFYPEQFRINDICTEWVKRGYKVTVVTGIPNYPEGKYYKGYGLFKKRKETFNGINIIRIPLIPRGNNKLMLILNYFSFVISGFFWKTFTRINADRVFIFEVSPMTQALPGVWYAKRKEIPCFLYVTDLWPENVEFVSGIKSRYILNSIGKMVDYIYKSSSLILLASQGFKQAVHERGVSNKKLEYWPQYAEDFYKPVKRNNTVQELIPADEKFNIIFAGNIGEAQGLYILIDVAQKLKSDSANIRFVIVGDGRFKKTLIEKTLAENIADMFLFLDKQPPEKIPELFAWCDVALIILAKSKVFSYTLPAKTQSCLASGIPVLVSADGEIQRIINEAKAGLCSKAGNVEDMVLNIHSMLRMSKKDLAVMAENGIIYSERYFKKEILLENIDKWFNSMN